jgi:DNA-binding GntR family transcriptional regulator
MRQQTDAGRNGESLKVHEQAQQYILDLIGGPAYSAGDRIPSERELADCTGISRMTIRKAIGHLIARGVLERRTTSGTFIPEPMIRRPFSGHMFVNGISETVRQCGGKPGSKTLMFEERAADVRVAQRLDIRPGAPLLVMRRLRYVNELPFCIETTHLRADRIPDLVAEDLVGEPSLFALLRNRYGIEMRDCRGLISMSAASRTEAEHLGLGRDPSVLLFQAVSYDVNGKPMEYLHSLNHPHRVVFDLSEPYQ